MTTENQAQGIKSRFVIGGRNNHIGLRVTDDQRAIIDGDARKQGISMSEWALRAVEVAIKKLGRVEGK